MKQKITSIIILILSIAMTALAAVPKAESERKIDWNKAEQNYRVALLSDNPGVRHSAAIFIAQYRLTGAVSDLKEMLRSDKTEQVRMAAALALIQIGNEEGRKAVQDAVLYDGSEKVSKFCEQLLKINTLDLSTR